MGFRGKSGGVRWSLGGDLEAFKFPLPPAQLVLELHVAALEVHVCFLQVVGFAGQPPDFCPAGAFHCPQLHPHTGISALPRHWVGGLS